MREDFKKVLCEEPRHGGWDGQGKALNKLKGNRKSYQNDTKGEYEDWSLPEKESMFGKRRRGTKAFGEHLQPLVRFLRSSVGRKWDDVFSEIRQNCPNDNAVNAHIYQHLWGYVERYAQFVDGKAYYVRHWSRFGLAPIEDRGRDNTFYIDQNGILRRAPRRVYEKKKPELNVFKHCKQIYVRKDGIWYKTALKPIPKPTRKIEEIPSYGGRTYKSEVLIYPDFADVYLGVASSYTYSGRGDKGARAAADCLRTYGRSVYCWQLRQLSSRELKKLGLKS